MNIAVRRQEAAASGNGRGLMGCLSFCLGVEEYGIDILKVQEIRGYEAATRMVNTPPFVLGVLNLRGVIVPIVDLRIRFGMAEVKYDSQTVTIVLNIDARVVGMVVDAVSDVVSLELEQIKPSPELAGARSSAQVIGIATTAEADGERMLILLDIDQLMRGADVGMLAQA
jgi:purine-binding chemotaxis protein CheW